MTVKPEQGAGSRATAIVSPEENSRDGQGTRVALWDAEPTRRMAWDSAAMPNGDPASLTLWGTDEER